MWEGLAIFAPVCGFQKLTSLASTEVYSPNRRLARGKPGSGISNILQPGRRVLQLVDVKIPEKAV
jgi:hypothetical protein